MYIHIYIYIYVYTICPGVPCRSRRTYDGLWPFWQLEISTALRYNYIYYMVSITIIIIVCHHVYHQHHVYTYIYIYILYRFMQQLICIHTQLYTYTHVSYTYTHVVFLSQTPVLGIMQTAYLRHRISSCISSASCVYIYIYIHCIHVCNSLYVYIYIHSAAPRQQRVGPRTMQRRATHLGRHYLSKATCLMRATACNTSWMALLVESCVSNAAACVFYGVTCLIRLSAFATLFTTFEESVCYTK